MQACNCEHKSHFDDGGDHPYGAEADSSYPAAFVGPICGMCAVGHLSEYVTRVGHQHYLSGISLLELSTLTGLLFQAHQRACKTLRYLAAQDAYDWQLDNTAIELRQLMEDASDLTTYLINH